MSEEIKDIFECLRKYANLTPDAIDDLYYLEGTIEDLQQKVEQQEKEIDRLNKEYERIYNENCKLREEHNITDIKLLDENNRLKNIIDELEKYLNQEIIEWQDASDLWTKAQVQEDRIVLDKLKALKENNK